MEIARYIQDAVDDDAKGKELGFFKELIIKGLVMGNGSSVLLSSTIQET